MTLKELAKFDALRIEMDDLDKRRLRQIAELQSSLTRVEGEHERLKKENEKLREWDDLVNKGKAPCGHWKAYMVTEDGGKHITCLQCDLSVLVSSLTRLLEGGYAQHKDGCKGAECAVCGDFKPGVRLEDGDCSTDKYGLHVWEGKPCTCDLDTLLTTLTRLARSPEEK